MARGSTGSSPSTALCGVFKRSLADENPAKDEQGAPLARVRPPVGTFLSSLIQKK
jgi:hypothetical protein